MRQTQKTNEQMQQNKLPQRRELSKSLQELNLMDDFLFDVATEDLEVCKIIIELSLNMRLQSIRWKEGQKVVHNLPGRRGIRMDFCAEDTDGNYFDVEMQKRNVGNIPKRTRFYQALVDAPMLKSGEEGFDNLQPVYIVVICGFDLYGYGKYRYSFSNCCAEIPGLIMGDECRKIFLNTKGNNADEVEKPLVDFLRYVERSDGSGITEDCDEKLKHLHEKVKRIKASGQVEVSYVRTQERERLIREEGREQGREQGREEGQVRKLLEQISKKLRRGDPLQKIADDLCEEVTLVQRFGDALQKCSPKYDPDEAFAYLKNAGDL